jgi:hypothetical protein
MKRTQSAGRAAAVGQKARDARRMVHSGSELLVAGVTRSQLAANIAADRWQRCGRAIVLHSGPLARDERWRAALVNCGPQSVLTAFTAAEFAGLKDWQREQIHVLDSPGARSPKNCPLPITLHRTSQWPASHWRSYRCHSPAPAIVIAAGTFDSARPGCGLLAAAVQQGLLTADQLLRALAEAARVRHHAALLAAVHDIAGGSQALSEIDFIRLCRRYRLPAPIQQLRRRDSSGRARYLDATWRRADDRLVVAEVDGALHLNPRRWWDDQLRQNELSLAGALVLRFPSVVVRTKPGLVAKQLRRALQC